MRRAAIIGKGGRWLQWGRSGSRVTMGGEDGNAEGPPPLRAAGLRPLPWKAEGVTGGIAPRLGHEDAQTLQTHPVACTNGPRWVPLSRW